MGYLIFDTETTGLPKDFSAPVSNSFNWPRVVQIAWQFHDYKGTLLESSSFLIDPNNFEVPFEAEKIHGISTALAKKEGIPLEKALTDFLSILKKTSLVVGHNIGFDIKVILAEFYRLNISNTLDKLPILDTCSEKTAFICKIQGGKKGKYKFPKLSELYSFLFNTSFQEAHNASADVEATSRCFFELIQRNTYSSNELFITESSLQEFINSNTSPFPNIGLKHENFQKKSLALQQESKVKTGEEIALSKELLEAPFFHIRNFSQYSILESTISIKNLLQAVIKNKMPAVGLTDKGNMMGVFNFIETINAYNKSIDEDSKKIKPIIGCEFNICNNALDKTKKNNGHSIVLLCKNKLGYQNLCKLSSFSFLEGFYYVPRIDYETLLKYKENLLVLSGGIEGDISKRILSLGIDNAEIQLKWWLTHFKEDFYLEITDHDLEEEKRVAPELIKFSQKYGAKLIATNHNFYLNPEDWMAQDILICIKEGQKQTTSIGIGRGFRKGLPNQNFYFRESLEIKKKFSTIAQAILNQQEFLEKIDFLILNKRYYFLLLIFLKNLKKIL